MNAHDVDVGDEVVVTRGDWAGQNGKVVTKCELPVSPNDGQPIALFTIHLAGVFNKKIQKRNLDIEKIAHAP